MRSLVLISFSFTRGGAAKSASRFYFVLKNKLHLKCISAEDSNNKPRSTFHLLKRCFFLPLVFFYQRKIEVKCSINIFSYKPAVNALNNESGLIHIHWINNDTLSIFDFKKIPYFSIITLHDEWLYCGIEHCFNIKGNFYLSPYCSLNNIGEKKHDSFLHKFVWSVKRNAFSKRGDIIVTCPSNWLAERARNSHVLKGCDIRVLYNPVDVFIFSPCYKKTMRQFNINSENSERFLILFGAVDGAKNKLKGFAELKEALKILALNEALKDQVVLGIFGSKKKGVKKLFGFPVHEFGYIKSEQEMSAIYSQAYVTIVPSKVESFGQVAAESQACETPVIAFNTSGLRDVVIDGKTGFLAEPYSAVSLAEKIELMLSSKADQYENFCKAARQHVVNNFSNAVIAKQYEAIIEEQWRKKQEAFK